MKNLVIKNGIIVNRGAKTEGDLLIENGRITRVGGIINVPNAEEIDAEGKTVIPGIIDDQVHFREPGLTHKADIYSESRAAAAGGVTTFMEMPNTVPNAVTLEELEKKYAIAARNSFVNYSFFLGATNDNAEEVKKADPAHICGIKIFMGSSTGNMLVDNTAALEQIFSQSPMLIATHCEDEETIRRNLFAFKEEYGDELTAKYHPLIRNTEACYKSSQFAISLAKKFNSRLHILHISTAKEIDLFTNSIPLSEKKITAEACVHHMFFNSDDYEKLGNLIKCNPAIKTEEDRLAIVEGVKSGKLDIIATDHAPHTWEEKSQKYLDAPSGLPLVQHSLQMMLTKQAFSIESVVDKMCHAPAICFQVKDRGFLDEGYFADLVIVDPMADFLVNKENIYYKCGWSPLEGMTLKGRIDTTLVNGEIVFQKGRFSQPGLGQRLTFAR